MTKIITKYLANIPIMPLFFSCTFNFRALLLSSLPCSKYKTYLKKFPLHVAYLGSHAHVRKKAQKMRKISEETPLNLENPSPKTLNKCCKCGTMEGICAPNPMEATTTSIGRPNQFCFWLFLEVLSEPTSVSSMSENKPQKGAEI
jgi:hypothetical protein